MSILAEQPDLAEQVAASRRNHLGRYITRYGNAQLIDAEWENKIAGLKKHADARLDNIDQQPHILEQLVAWINDPTWALILTGDFDAGKTFAAVAIAHELAWRGHNLKALTARDMLASIKPAGGSRLADYLETSLLVLDGLSEVELSRWDIEQIKAVLLDRYEHDRPTIVTTNLEPGHLRRKFGNAVWTRLDDRGRVLVLNDTGRRASRDRFASNLVEMIERIDAYRQITNLPEHLRPIARERIRAEVTHDPMHPAFSRDELDTIESVCDELQDEWKQRVESLRQAIEPLTTGPHAPHQVYDWFADEYRRQSAGEVFRLTVLDPARISGDDIERIEAIAAEVGVLDRIPVAGPA